MKDKLIEQIKTGVLTVGLNYDINETEEDFMFKTVDEEQMILPNFTLFLDITYYIKIDRGVSGSDGEPDDPGEEKLSLHDFGINEITKNENDEKLKLTPKEFSEVWIYINQRLKQLI